MSDKDVIDSTPHKLITFFCSKSLNIERFLFVTQTDNASLLSWEVCCREGVWVFELWHPKIITLVCKYLMVVHTHH